MTIMRAFVVLVLSTLLTGAIGGGIGYGMGRFNPGYYRGVFRGGDEPHFDPISVGVGLGLTQGIVGGVIVGVVLAALLSWRDVRLHSRLNTQSGGTLEPSRLRSLAIVGSILGMFICGVIGLVLGRFVGERGAYDRRFDADESILKRLLASDPAFAGIQIEEYSAGDAYLVGTIRSQADEDRLREAAIRALGEARVKHMLNGVDIRGK